MSPQLSSNRRQRTPKKCPASLLSRVLAAVDGPSRTELFRCVSPADCYSIYNKLEHQSQGRDFATRCEYYSRERLFVVRAMPSAVHECIQDWFLLILSQMKDGRFVFWRDWLHPISRNVGMGKSHILLLMEG